MLRLLAGLPFLSKILEKPVHTLVVLTVVVLGLLPIASRLTFDGSMHVLYEKNNELDLFNKALKKKFGNIDEIVVMAVTLSDPFSKEGIQKITQLHKEIEQTEGVRSCYSLSNVKYFYSEVVDDEEVTEFSNYLELSSTDRFDKKSLRETALANSLYLKNFISTDGNSVGFNIVFKNGLNSTEKEAVVKRINKVLEKVQEKNYLTGMHVFMEYASRFIQNDVIVFTCSLVVVMFISLFLIFRSPKIALLLVSSSGISNIVTIAITNLLGLKISVATTAAPAVITALTIAYMLHVVTCRLSALKHVLWANFLAAFTSFLGFLAMVVNPLPTVHELGIFLCIGSMAAFYTSYFFGAPVKKLLKKDIGEAHIGVKISQFISKCVHKHRVVIYIASGVLLFITIFFHLMEVDTNYYKYFKKPTKLTKSVDFVNHNLSGQYPLIVSIESDKGVLTPKALRYIYNLTEWIRAKHGVSKATNIIDLLKEPYKAFSDKIERDWFLGEGVAGEMKLMLESADRELLGYYLSYDEKSTIITVRTTLIGSRSFKNLYDKLEEHLKKNPSSEVNVRLGGTYLNVVGSADKMASTQLYSTIMAILVILFIVLFVLKNIQLSWIAVVANVIPVMSIYGIMGLAGESINMGTAIIASIAFGIAVDDTIHFLTRFSELSKTENIEVSLTNVFEKTVPSILYTSFVLGVGFLVLGFSSFKPIYQLGLYTTLTVTLCVIADVFFLPRLILDFYKKKGS